VLIIYESSIDAFLLTALYLIYLVVILAYHLFPALTEYQPLVYSTLLFPPAVQTYCSGAKEDLEYFNMVF
jgi:hypothetical protein